VVKYFITLLLNHTAQFMICATPITQNNYLETETNQFPLYFPPLLKRRDYHEISYSYG